MHKWGGDPVALRGIDDQDAAMQHSIGPDGGLIAGDPPHDQHAPDANEHAHDEALRGILEAGGATGTPGSAARSRTSPSSTTTTRSSARW